MARGLFLGHGTTGRPGENLARPKGGALTEPFKSRSGKLDEVVVGGA